MHEHRESVTARVAVTKRISFNCIAAAMLTVFLSAVAFGQSMYATLYSDTWVDTDYLYACGVTEGYDFGHHARVKTRITAPNGSYNEYDTGELAESYAVANVSFPLYYGVYPGEYVTQSDHWQWCPTAFALEFAGLTFAYAASGESQAIYKPSYCTVSTPGPPLTLYCEFVPLDTCPSLKCMPSTLVRRPTIPPDSAPTADFRIVRLQAWVEVSGYKVCLPGTSEIDAPYGTPLDCKELP